MNRIGYIIEEIISDENMENSFCEVLRGTKRKRSGQGRYLLAHKKEVLDELVREIAAGTFRVEEYREREIMEGGKLRRIQIIRMKKSIGVHAIMNVVDKHIRKRFIRTTSASIKGRGTHDLLSYIERDIREDPEGTVFGYKFDIQKFYENVNQDVMVRCIKHIFKDKALIAILEGLIRLMDKGISIGLRSSQGNGNLLLSVHLDHYLKDKLGIKYFYRYCDDGLVLARSKEELWIIRDAIHAAVAEIGLKIKPNERIFPITEGIDFLGYVIRPGYTRLRKRIKKKFARKIKELKSEKRKQVLVASFYGMTKHADCNVLFKKLTGKDMRAFKDLNVTYRPDDGKKRLPGTVVSVRELVNLPITVRDFEMGIKTEQGDDRCIVAIEVGGEPRKFLYQQ